MASLEQFSVSWDNFHKEIRSGMNSLLENEDFIDVTLAIEGRYLKAHKMVLSVCSSYFRELFKTTPCKHPIVFMKDVTYSAMSDLLQFMYKGEVQVSEENFNTFIQTAESLRIKGLSKCGDVLADSQQKKALSMESEAPTLNKTRQPHSVSKRLRLDDYTDPTEYDIVKTEPVKIETATATSTLSDEKAIYFKTEPYNEEESSIMMSDDNSSDNLFDSTLENKNVDENDDSWVMQGDDKVPEVRTDEKTLPGEEEFDPSEIENSAGPVIPEKSKERYESTFTCFEQWRNENNVEDIDENVLINYFKEKSITHKSSSLMTCYSMLRIMLSIKKNIDTSKYKRVVLFLKKISEGYKAKKTKILKKEHFERFLREANDDIFLMKKVAMIIGVAGACRKSELTYLQTESVIDEGNCIRFQLSDDNNESCREFRVTPGNIKNVNLVEIIRKYINLRPPMTDHQRFFVCYRHGKCTRQPVGKHTFGAIPKNIAEFLGLPNPEDYTGHCFRKTSMLFKLVPESRSFP